LVAVSVHYLILELEEDEHKKFELKERLFTISPTSRIQIKDVTLKIITFWRIFRQQKEMSRLIKKYRE
jgi:hypothetical protein